MIHQWQMRHALQAFADGELPETRRASLAAHLEQCAECARVLDRLRHGDRLLRMVRPEPEALSPQASRALLERVLAETGPARRAPHFGSAPLSWGLATVLFLTAGATIGWWYLPGIATRGHSGGTPMATRPPQDRFSNTVWLAGNPAVTAKESKASVKATPRAVKPAALSGKGALAGKKKEAPAVAPPAPAPPRSEQRPRRNLQPRYRLASVTPGGGMTEAGASLPKAAPASVSLLSGDEAPLGMAWASPSEVVRPEGTELANGAALEGSPEAGEAGEAAAQPEGQLLVIVTAGLESSPAKVTRAPETAPGYARVSAFRPDPDGRWTWTEATISTEWSSSKHSLVMLGSNSLEWEEDEHGEALGRDKEDGNHGDAAPDPGAERGRDGGDGADGEQE